MNNIFYKGAITLLYKCEILRPPCEEIVQEFLPTFRSLIAKELIEKYNFSQVEVAEKLGTTQAAVSQYLSSKRGQKNFSKVKSMTRVKTVANEVAKDMAENKLEEFDITSSFCKLCLELRTNQPRRKSK
ncbi:helix-turn-helix domain-containing protein [Candidatus Bathyarchaeota archaeon]|nr:helix-turn-helix domain-containing protein [Candidatus Bathyarchaeota archaeon]